MRPLIPLMPGTNNKFRKLKPCTRVACNFLKDILLYSYRDSCAASWIGRADDIVAFTYWVGCAVDGSRRVEVIVGFTYRDGCVVDGSDIICMENYYI